MIVSLPCSANRFLLHCSHSPVGPGVPPQALEGTDRPGLDGFVILEAGQVVGQVPSAGVAAGRVFFQTLQANGGQVARQAQIVYPYQASGNYTYSILERPVGGCGATPTPTPLPDIPNVRLFVTPSSVDVNQTVRFVAELSGPARNFSYRFVFDDGSKTEWQTESKATHAYSIPKTYRAYVDIGLPMNGVIKQLGGSKRHAITVAANPFGRMV